MFSGGVGSWAAARRVADRFGTSDLTLLFTDTLMEDEDLYRFLEEAATNIGAPLVKIAEGRTPWEVFWDKRFLGNSRVDPCSQVLKRQMGDRWLTETHDPADTTVYVGIDWTEEERYTVLRQRKAAIGWTYEAPMIAPPRLSKRDIFRNLQAVGIRPPRLYDLGFVHNNCGGFCVKAGHGHFATLLRTMPERYVYHEQKEQEIRALLGDVAIMADRTGDNIKKPLTMREFRERVQLAGWQPDMFDLGGCGCFLDEPAEARQEQE
jgi:hypothetical protein